MVKLVETSYPQEALGKVTPSPLIFFFFVLKAFQRLFIKLPMIIRLVECPLVGDVQNHSSLLCWWQSFFFCKAKEHECQKLVDILNSYEVASGQKINTDKSSIFFSPNTPQERKESILNILGPMQDSRHNKYLGLPTIIGKSKAQVFAKLKDRVAKKTLLVGKGNFFLLVGGRFLSRRLPKQCPHIQWVASNSLKLCAKI